MRVKKFKAVWDYALALQAAGQTQTFEQLRMWLNANGYRSGPPWNNPYWTSRGVARLVSAVYAYVETELGLGAAAADPIAKAFTKQNGEYAY